MTNWLQNLTLILNSNLDLKPRELWVVMQGQIPEAANSFWELLHWFFQLARSRQILDGHSEPAPTSTPSTGCPFYSIVDETQLS
jgi:hypothetical protein